LVGRSSRELRQLRGSDISMVYQEPMSSLNPVMKIEDQLLETLIAHQGLSRQAARRKCVQILQELYMPDIERVLGRFAFEISGGQQQRVLIAMAMLNNPALMIMDEPTTALDVTVEAAMLDLMAKLREKYRTATLYITHNLGVVARVADKVAVMYAGEIVELAPTGTIYHTPLHPYTVGLMRCLPDVDAPKGTRELQPIKGQIPALDQVPAGCIFSPRCEYAAPQCSDDHPQLHQIAPGHQVRCIFAEKWLSSPAWGSRLPEAHRDREDDAEISKTILNAAHLKVYYPVASKSLTGAFKPKQYVKAVDDVSISAKRGCTLGIVGESGCGKSTLAKALVGLEPLEDGKIEFLEADISKPLRQRSIALIQQMQMVFQDPDSVLNPSYTVGNQIATSLRRFRIVPKEQEYDETIRLLKSVKLDERYFERLPRQLSGGEKQRVGIARALAANPSMLVCDEPVSALDVSVQASVTMLLAEIQRLRNMSIILISHDLSTVRYLSDHIVVMYVGQVMEQGSSEAIYTPPSHPYTAALLAAVPRADPDVEPAEFRLSGAVPSAINPPKGCRFHTRCPVKLGKVCETEAPRVHDLGAEHRIYCHLPESELARLRSTAAKPKGPATALRGV
jgi:peptide/nickel transport system ATP-binding protein